MASQYVRWPWSQGQRWCLDIDQRGILYSVQIKTILVWLFYIQHQFKGVYWSRHDQWDPIKASLYGSSFCKLPKVIQWFTGNIGLHHIHHLRARIPNYNLQRAYDDTSVFLNVEPLSLRESITCLRLKLWDEKRKELVGFKSAYAWAKQHKHACA